MKESAGAYSTAESLLGPMTTSTMATAATPATTAAATTIPAILAFTVTSLARYRASQGLRLFARADTMQAKELRGRMLLSRAFATSRPLRTLFSAGYQRRVYSFEHNLAVDDALADVFFTGQVVHDV